jgi:uncharacterized protein (TIGR00369 family)
MSVDERAARMFAETPVNGWLKFRLVARAPDRVEVRAPVLREAAQEYGLVQGGILSALADTAAVYLLIPEAMDRGRVNSIEFKVNFLRPATPDAGELVAVATPVKIGRRVAVCSVDVTQGERLVARGTFTYLIEL